MSGSVNLILVFGLITFFNVINSSTIKSDLSTNAPIVSYRLPNNTKPLLYDINLETRVDKEDFNFNGVVKITLKVQSNSNEIVIHARQLEIIEVNLLDFNNKLISVKYKLENVTEFLKINTEQQLLEGKEYILTVKYKGELRNDMSGFYKSSYKTSGGKIVYLATTQFEPTDARHAFPCYDEPAIKAKFIITLKHGQTYNAQSNMPIDGKPVNNTDGTAITKFMKTPLMSTYLIAFVVSDFESTSGTLNRFTQRVFSRPETKDEQKFALETGLKTLNGLNEYFGVSYSLPKMDQVSIPDFAAGAMENWGLVTYREEYLLYDEKKSTTATQYSIATIISHEYAHQWFGNLVSPVWWTYTWLNEGFATLYSYMGSHKVYPSWKLMEYFMTSEYQRGLAADSENSPRPMTHYIESPRDIKGVFDGISYSKAGSVLRMIQHVLTEKTFKKALNHYLKKMSYKSATEEDLIESFLYAGNEDGVLVGKSIDLKKFILSWTRQGGAPFLTVTRNYEKGTITITQTPLTRSDDDPKDSRLWWIPFNIITKRFPDFDNTIPDDYVHSVKSIEINVTGSHNLTNTDWLLLNKQQTGYYRVNYDIENWRLISNALVEKFDTIHTYNRAQLINDAFTLVSNQKLPIKILLDLLKYIKDETDYAPWVSAVRVFSQFNYYLDGNENYNLFKFYSENLIKPFFDKIGVADDQTEEHLHKLLRPSIINLACSIGVSTCLQMTNEKLNSLVEDNIEIEPNLQGAIYCNGLKDGDEKEFTYLFEHFLKLDDQAARRRIMAALGCTQNTDQLKFYLKSSINKTIKYQLGERNDILRIVYSNGGHLGVTETLDFLLENYKEYSKLVEEFSKVKTLLINLHGLSSIVVETENIKKFKELIEKSKEILNLDDKVIETLNSNIDKNLEWIKVYYPEIVSYLKENKKASSATTIFTSITLIVASLVLSFRTLI